MAGPRVGHLDHDRRGFAAQREGDRPVGQRELHGVRQQVAHDLLHGVAVGCDVALRGRIHQQLQLLALGGEPEGFHGAAQLVDQLQQPARVALREVEPLPPLFLHLLLIAQAIERRNHERERRTQLV